MINIIKMNIKDTVKNPNYLIMTVITCIIPLYSILQMAKVYTIPSGSSFMVVFTSLVFNVTIFSFLTSVTIPLIVISEKISGRCEYYLANGANLLTLVKSYCLSSFILCIIPIIFYTFLSFLLAHMMNIKVLTEVITSIYFLFFLVGLLIFCLFCTLLLNVLTMVAKRPERIRLYLSLLSFANVYITILPMKLLIRLGFKLDSITIINLVSLTLLILSVIITLILHFLFKKLHTETVILSYKQ